MWAFLCGCLAVAVVGTEVVDDTEVVEVVDTEDTEVPVDTDVARVRPVQVVLALDITTSWDKDEYAYVRAAALGFFDAFAAAPEPDDRFGASVFWSNYAYEYVPMMRVSDAVAHPPIARDLLGTVNVGNFAGLAEPAWEPPEQPSAHIACRVYGTSGAGAGNVTNGIFADISGAYYNALKNTWSESAASPPDGIPGRGCHPSMPRYYLSEGGTDAHTGLLMPRRMLLEPRRYDPATGWIDAAEPAAYRAVVVITDGIANSVARPGTLRDGVVTGAGDTSDDAVPSALAWTYEDTSYPAPWQSTAGIALREHRRDVAHAEADVRGDTIALANHLYEAEATSVWFVSFRAMDASMFAAASVGDGRYTYVPMGRPDGLPDALAAIAAEVLGAAGR